VSIQATEAVSSWGSIPGATPAETDTKAQEDKDMFLQLMVAQLRYQDPLNPSDSGEFLAQSAQFTALEKMQDVADRTAELLGAQMAFGASALVGRHVSWLGEDGTTTMTGTIDGVTFGKSGPVFDIDGTEVPIGSILSVTAETSSSTAPSSTASSTASA
jgi:flagellar basal-body rod modification protein FlgD